MDAGEREIRNPRTGQRLRFIDEGPGRLRVASGGYGSFTAPVRRSKVPPEMARVTSSTRTPSQSKITSLMVDDGESPVGWIASDGTGLEAEREGAMHERGERHPWQMAPLQRGPCWPGDSAERMGLE